MRAIEKKRGKKKELFLLILFHCHTVLFQVIFRGQLDALRNIQIEVKPKLADNKIEDVQFHLLHYTVQ